MQMNESIYYTTPLYNDVTSSDYNNYNIDNSIYNLDNIIGIGNIHYENENNTYNIICAVKDEMVKYIENNNEEIFNVIKTEIDIDSNNNDSDNNNLFYKMLKNMLTQFKIEYNKIQNELLLCEKNLVKSLKEHIEDINTIDNLINTSYKLSSKYSNEDNNILNNSLINLCNEIKKKSKINEIKKNILNKEILNKLKPIINEINSLNYSYTCPICYVNKISIYCDPCGHTICEDCSIKNQSNNNNNYDNIKCYICRKTVKSYNKLFINP